MSWSSVAGWTGQGGSVLGTKRLANRSCLLLLLLLLSSLYASHNGILNAIPPGPCPIPAWKSWLKILPTTTSSHC